MKQRDVSVWQEERAKEFCEEWYKTQVKKDHKIVVIDDDPTGTQTVHDVPVYTAYDLEHIRKGFKEETPLFYVLTNSRSLKQKDEYSCAMKSHFRKFGNQMSGSGNHLYNYAILLA